MDARIASMKQNMLVYLNSGHDIATATEMKTAIDAFTGKYKIELKEIFNKILLGVKGTKVAVLKINRKFERRMKAKTTIPGISKMYSFSYERYFS